MAQSAVTLPDYLLEPNAVLLDNIPWRHGQVSRQFVLILANDFNRTLSMQQT